MNHLRNYIGWYLLVLTTIGIWADWETQDYWALWFAYPIILWKTPPFDWGDKFWGAYSRMLDFVLRPLTNWIKTWPTWARTLFALAMIILIEEYVLAPLGYTVYPWRMDFSG